MSEMRIAHLCLAVAPKCSNYNKYFQGNKTFSDAPRYGALLSTNQLEVS